MSNTETVSETAMVEKKLYPVSVLLIVLWKSTGRRLIITAQPKRTTDTPILFHTQRGLKMKEE